MFNEMFNTFGNEEHKEYPKFSSVNRQQLIATINAVERIPRVSFLSDETIENISGRDIIDAINDDTFNTCMDHEEYAYDADDMLETLTDLRTAVNLGAGHYSLIFSKLMDLRDNLFYEWNSSDLLVEGLRGDGTLYRAPTVEEYAMHPERYLEGSALVPHSLKIIGYTMENVSSGEPVLLSAADYEMAAKAFINHGGSLEEFL